MGSNINQDTPKKVGDVPEQGVRDAGIYTVRFHVTVGYIQFIQ